MKSDVRVSDFLYRRRIKMRYDKPHCDYNTLVPIGCVASFCIGCTESRNTHIQALLQIPACPSRSSNRFMAFSHNVRSLLLGLIVWGVLLSSSFRAIAQEGRVPPQPGQATPPPNQPGSHLLHRGSHQTSLGNRGNQGNRIKPLRVMPQRQLHP